MESHTVGAAAVRTDQDPGQALLTYGVQVVLSHMLCPTAQVTSSSEVEDSDSTGSHPGAKSRLGFLIPTPPSNKIIPPSLHSCKAMNQLGLDPQYGQVG